MYSQGSSEISGINYFVPHVDQRSSVNVDNHGSMHTYNASFQANFNPVYGSIHTFNNESLPVLTIELRENDEEVLEKFVEEIASTDKISYKDKKVSQLKISEAKTALITTHRLCNKLKSIHSKLKDGELSGTEWKEKLKECKEIKGTISELLEKLKDPEFNGNLVKALKMRKKKRLREKRKRAKNKVEKAFITERRVRLHTEADMWIKNKQDIIEREKQEDNMRKDADIILADVRGKRNDAKRFLGLLQELQNLRKVKANIARARGEHLSSAADETFSNIIVRLIEQWTALDRDYSLEEQGLKLMVKADNELKIEKQTRSTFKEWEHAIFGKKYPSFDFSQKDLNAFITLRKAWDTYVRYDGEGSPIPVGWIMPDVPSSAAWQKYLK
ncbi:programmed cell death protein 7 [Orussus abietinus]|uniref:programmed cell death protein 7 n=1 Tax=Orussus abietinus TaxID=222816 RepID=UPI000625545D|nr:programmed cell death protein 7 [Orussus abietinus]